MCPPQLFKVQEACPPWQLVNLPLKQKAPQREPKTVMIPLWHHNPLADSNPPADEQLVTK